MVPSSAFSGIGRPHKFPDSGNCVFPAYYHSYHRARGYILNQHIKKTFIFYGPDNACMQFPCRFLIIFNFSIVRSSFSKRDMISPTNFFLHPIGFDYNQASFNIIVNFIRPVSSLIIPVSVHLSNRSPFIEYFCNKGKLSSLSSKVCRN